MAAIPLIRQQPFHLIVSTLDTMNADVGRLLHRHGIPDWRYCDPEDAIPLLHYIKAFDIGARAVGEERFAIIVAERNGLDRLAGFGEAILGSLTVYDALRTACRLASKEATTLRFWLQRTSGGVLFCRKQLVTMPEIEAALLQLERYTLTLLVQIVRLGAGRHWRPRGAFLSASENTSVSEWEALSEARLRFRAPFSAILVPDHVLSLPIEGRSAGSCIAADSAERRLRETWDGQDFVSTLQLALKSLLGQKATDVETIAEIAGISTRTVQRRLSEQGTSFREVLDQARYQAALKLLRQSEITVADISDCVGYEHPQHFIRAFRRWAGVTPGRYRECLSVPYGNDPAPAGTH